jgi:hypothetical protein
MGNVRMVLDGIRVDLRDYRLSESMSSVCELIMNMSSELFEINFSTYIDFFHK